MARIPKFQRSRLASSLIGTPGLDQIGRDVQTSANAFQGALTDVSNAAAEESFKRKQAQETTEANRRLLDFELGAEEDFESHKLEFEGSPDKKTDLFRERLDERLNNTLNEIESDEVRQSVSNMAQQVIRQKSLKELDWSKKQQAVVSFNNLTASVDSLAKQARIAGSNNDQQRLSELLAGIPGVLVSGDTVLSQEQRLELRTAAPKSVVSGYMYGLMDNKPEEALALIKSGALENVLTTDELKKFRNDAEARMKKLNDILETERLIKGIDQNEGLWDAFREGELTVDELDAMEETPFVNQMREMVLKTNPADASTKASTEVKLWNRYNELVKKKNGKVKAKGQLDELITFQQEVVEAFNKGEITQERVNTFMKDLAVPLANEAKKATGKKGFFSGKFKSPFEEGVDIVNDWLKEQGEDKDAETKLRMFNDLVELMPNVGAQDKEKGTLTINDVADLVKEREKDRRYPERRLYRNAKIGEKMTVFGIPVVFNGFTPSGEPDFLEDEDANP